MTAISDLAFPNVRRAQRFPSSNETQQEITAACKGARPNHIGVVISRHKRAGRIEQRDGKLYATQSTRREQGAAL